MVFWPSPLNDFVNNLHLASQERNVEFLINIGYRETDHDLVVLQDVEMLLMYGPVVGIRSAWVRRTAQPIYMAWKKLQDKSDADRFLYAYEIAQQTQDQEWRGKALAYITDRGDALSKRQQAKRAAEEKAEQSGPTLGQKILGLFK
jgi:hypothetical protein